MGLPVDHPPEQAGHAVHVQLARQVKAQHALLPLELLEQQAGVFASPPGLHVEEAGLRRNPDVQVLGLEGVGEAGRSNGALLLTDQVLLEHRHAEVGIGLGQHLGVGPLVPLVDGPDPAEQLIVGDDAFQHLDHLPALVVARPFDVRAGCGDDEHQRLAAGAHAGKHGLVQGRRIVLVVLVHDGATGRSTIARVADQRLKSTGVGGLVQVGGVDLDSRGLHQKRRSLHHQACWSEHLPGLLLRGGTGIHLGAELVVGHEHAQADAGGDHALAVLPGHFPVAFAEASEARLLPDPAEGDGQAEKLPGLQGHQLALERPLTLGVRQKLDQFQLLLGLRRVELVAELAAATCGQIVEMALASQLHVPAARHLPGHHPFRPPHSCVDVRVLGRHISQSGGRGMGCWFSASYRR
ncbi:hypothetical protein FQZ97_803610 [compost metagenome]